MARSDVAGAACEGLEGIFEKNQHLRQNWHIGCVMNDVATRQAVPAVTL